MSITNAVNSIWPQPQTKRSMCFAHVYRNVEKYSKSMQENIKSDVLSDIYILQAARNNEEFEKGC